MRKTVDWGILPQGVSLSFFFFFFQGLVKATLDS